MTRPTNSIVFVHGAWMTARSWDNFLPPFEAAGYTVHVPTWPGLDGLSAAEINKAPPAGLGSLRIGQIVDHYADFIRTLPEPPVLIGHSFGGLIVQLLLDRGLGAAGIALDPAPIGGVPAGWRALLSAFPILARWNGWNRPYALDLGEFAAKFANAAPAGQQAEAHRSVVIPTPGRIFYQAAFMLGTWISPKRRNVPLLVTGGERDNLVTPFMSRLTYLQQKRSPARTDYRLFKGRSHFLTAEPGWEEVAATSVAWLDTVLGTTADRPLRAAA
ncbi:alpha/beta hydrolase [Sphingoaurantiacus capsulatus]|uniref:Alpha/beta hydrolase n=1 Tax=Sphingoaurantiacus capsulatus TaxID=1771310 RepID=A0ABV7XA30_9SPHN